MRGASTADQEGAGKAVMAGGPAEAGQEPAQGGGYQGAEAGHPMQATKAALRRSIKRDARSQGDLCEQATGP